MTRSPWATLAKWETPGRSCTCKYGLTWAFSTSACRQLGQHAWILAKPVMSKSGSTWELIQDCVSAVLIFFPHVIKKSYNGQKRRKQKGWFLNNPSFVSPTSLCPCPCRVFAVQVLSRVSPWVLKNHSQPGRATCRKSEVGGDCAGVSDRVLWLSVSSPGKYSRSLDIKISPGIPALRLRGGHGLPCRPLPEMPLPAPWSWAFGTLLSLSWDPHDANWKQDLGAALLVKLKLVSTEGNGFAAFPPVSGARAGGHRSWAGNRGL